MDNSPIMFKGQINGFDKKAVISYIFELNESHQSALAKIKAQLEEAKEAKENAERQLNESKGKAPRLENEVSSLTAQVNTLTAQLNSEREHSAGLDDMLANLNTEIDHLRDSLARKEEELAECSTTNSSASQEAEEKLRALEEERLQLAEKEKEVERASAQIGRLLLDATADADRIRQEAGTDAAALLAQAKDEAAGILSAAGQDADRITADARDKADQLLSESSARLEEAARRFQFFRKDLNAIQSTILEASNTMSDKARAVTGVLDLLGEKMQADLLPRSDSTSSESSGGSPR